MTYFPSEDGVETTTNQEVQEETKVEKVQGVGRILDGVGVDLEEILELSLGAAVVVGEGMTLGATTTITDGLEVVLEVDEEEILQDGAEVGAEVGQIETQIRDGVGMGLEEILLGVVGILQEATMEGGVETEAGVGQALVVGMEGFKPFKAKDKIVEVGIITIMEGGTTMVQAEVVVVVVEAGTEILGTINKTITCFKEEVVGAPIIIKTDGISMANIKIKINTILITIIPTR
jgi:hypothetical protein